MPWNPRPRSIFHDESWSTLWRSSEFPPEETFAERYNRQHAKPEWKSVPYFLNYQSSQPGGWPWGWAIYRTSYANTSDEDWARAIEKLDQACLADLEFYESRWSRTGDIYVEMIREGYRNVIFEDPTLEGASEAVIQYRHKQWVEDLGLMVCSAVPRLNYPLLLDQRWGMVSYVNVLDGDFVLEELEEEDGQYYLGLNWGSWGMDNLNSVPYVDGRLFELEMKQMFLSTPDRNLERTLSLSTKGTSDGY
ncbi:hypothetical protein N7449_000979 [Penicillium cf. viridicatum]|uniref:Uncharacterized protein n=1 Tax=Penicillium cf. viridicatum TaxID=2972119 RepID=A0A9W9N613_9EURO|nr:hypothetical protein N7449_000979 [Penicillium cf. viridicatum]